jgi:hypothetical protein
MSNYESDLPPKHSTVHCHLHGETAPAFLCEHLLNGTRLGFIYDTDSENPTPDAWCANCELIRVQHGGWDEVSEALTKIKLVCATCYHEIKEKNVLPSDNSPNIQ